jgi:hypothetical protein
MLRSDHSAFSSSLPTLITRWLQVPALRALACLAALFAFGCTPHIGDSCTTSTNCSAAGDRLCDITQPGGYCTQFNCEPDGCPDDSICVNFGTALSPVGQCTASQDNSPYMRTFCMAPCGNDGDCRGGYVCQDLDPGSTTNFIGDVEVDYVRHSAVCAVKPTAMPVTRVVYSDGGDGGGTSTEVCVGSDLGPPADTSSGGASGAGG